MPSFDYAQGQAFLRDSFVPFSAANVSIASSPVLYGLSVYTVFSVNWNEAEKKHYAFRLKDHYRRLELLRRGSFSGRHCRPEGQ